MGRPSSRARREPRRHPSADSRAQHNRRTTQLLAGDPAEGSEKLERSLELGQAGRLRRGRRGRGFIHLVWAGTRLRTYELPDRYLDQGLAYLTERGLDLWRLYAAAFRARIELDRGHWSGAVDSGPRAEACNSTFPRIQALVVLALVRARRGEPDAQSPLDDALAMATPTGELPRIAPVAAARAEVAWLAGDSEGVAVATEDAYRLALKQGVAWPIGELACWRWRAGLQHEAPDEARSRTRSRSPATGRAQRTMDGDRLSLRSRPRACRRRRWDAVRRALDKLHQLGAQTAAEVVGRRLQHE